MLTSVIVLPFVLMFIGTRLSNYIGKHINLHLFKTPVHQCFSIVYLKSKPFEWIYNKNLIKNEFQTFSKNIIFIYSSLINMTAKSKTAVNVGWLCMWIFGSYLVNRRLLVALSLNRKRAFLVVLHYTQLSTQNCSAIFIWRIKRLFYILSRYTVKTRFWNTILLM